MVVNDVPGEECRIAILEDNYLEELYSERNATATKVGNIYKGRVVNVEPAIQAAFIDYGEGVNGFLHISDLHPRYFPGAERTERVGRKIPRRERPPIQEALKRGDQILVQVLKEGLGTKGPTLTSYLSIPGRLLVVMPEMDRVGVSRRVEDEEGRREMRKILDALDLPDGFGFILRTAGVGRTKTELKRDVAYLMRLWKVMEKRIEKVGAPCELYTESDLLIRTVRDVLRPSIQAIVVDSESAYDRISTFLQVIAPRSAPKVVRYRRSAPIFHAFDIERQIDLIHSREVPLASGGRLVIDQTEALVAIDVNSGKSRSARDSETNAYQTNCEAVDEICRQLRLRDLGGLIIHDLIDMRQHKNRRLIEARFQENLKRDRARSTILRISDFGLVEMTRQRMRPSMRKSHFVPCPHCDGNGEIKAADSVASEATRHVGYLLDQDRIKRVEIVCSSRVASVLLSRKRRELVRLEESTGKTIDVRVSDHIGGTGVEYYAYDSRNADIDLEFLPRARMPRLEDLEAEDKSAEARGSTDESTPSSPGRRRRRRRRGGPADASAIALATANEMPFEEGEDEGPAAVAEESTDEQEAAPARKRSRRRRRRKRGDAAPVEAAEAASADAPDKDAKTDAPADGEDAKPDDRRAIRVHELARELGIPSREVLQRCVDEGTVACKNHMTSVTPADADTIRGWFKAGTATDAGDVVATDASSAPAKDTSSPAKESGEIQPRRRRRRRGGRRRGGRDGDAAAEGKAASNEPQKATMPAAATSPDAADESTDATPKKKSRRSRRGGRGRAKGSGGGGGDAKAAKNGSSGPEASGKEPSDGSGPKPASPVSKPGSEDPSPPAEKSRSRPAAEADGKNGKDRFPRGRKKTRGGKSAKDSDTAAEPKPVITTTTDGRPPAPVKKRRTLYGASRRPISPATVEREASER